MATGIIKNVTSTVEEHQNYWVDAIADLHPAVTATFAFLGDWVLTTLGALAALLICNLRKYMMRWFYAIAAGMILCTSTVGLYSEALTRASQKGVWSAKVPWVPAVVGSIGGIVILQGTTSLVFAMNAWRESRRKQTPSGGYSVQLDDSKFRVDDDEDIEDLVEKSKRRPLLTAEIELQRARVEQRMQPIQRVAVMAAVGSNKHENRATQEMRRVISIAGSMIIQQFPEGIMLGATFANVWGQETAAAQRQALRLAVGVMIGAWITSVGEAAAIVLPMRKSRIHWCRTMIFVQLACIMQGLAVYLSCLTLTYVQPLMPFALSGVAAMSLFVVCSEMIPEAFSGGARLVPNALLWAGFLLQIILVKLFN